ncbi:MAG: DUF1844 domain-containing protein [Phycisphaera sp.]|nr:DUF1844 domain-containing protein [Phycisphaera sp.]
MSDESNDELPKIHVDSDWKAQAQAEKERLAQEAAEAEGEGDYQLPDADFKTLVSTLVSQALLAMGAIPDPMTGQRIISLELASHHINMLDVLEQKTQGNLDEDESSLLKQALHELRTNFVELSKHVAAHQAQQAAGGGQRGPLGGQPGGGAGPIIAP